MISSMRCLQSGCISVTVESSTISTTGCYSLVSQHPNISSVVPTHCPGSDNSAFGGNLSVFGLLFGLLLMAAGCPNRELGCDETSKPSYVSILTKIIEDVLTAQFVQICVRIRSQQAACLWSSCMSMSQPCHRSYHGSEVFCVRWRNLERFLAHCFLQDSIGPPALHIRLHHVSRLLEASPGARNVSLYRSGLSAIYHTSSATWSSFLNTLNAAND